MPKPEPPIVMTTNVSISGFRDRSCNERRIDAAIRLIQFARQNFIDCVCFPAGYLLAKNEAEIPYLLEPIIRQAQRQAKASFVIGVDTAAILNYPADLNSPKMLKAVRQGNMPCFLAAYSHQQDTLQNHQQDALRIHRQRSATFWHVASKILPDNDRSIKEVRFMPLGTTGFGILACGEIFDRRMTPRSEHGLSAAIAHFHTTYSRMSRTLSSVSKTGVSILVMQHMKGRGGLAPNWTYGINRSVYTKPCPLDFGRDGPWIDMALWELTEYGFRAAKSRPSLFRG